MLIRNLKQADVAVAQFASATDNRLTAIDRSFARAGTGVKAIVGGLLAAASVGSLVSLAKEGLAYASSLDEVSQQIGVTARDLQVLRYAGSQVGISNEEMETALQKFTKSLGEARAGAAPAKGVFRELGFTDAEIKHLDVHDAMLKTADGIGRIGDRASRAAPEVALFGRAGQQLDTLLSGGAAAINQLAHEAEELGIVLSRDQIENADRTADRLSALKQVLESRIAGVVAENADAIYTFANALAEVADKAGKAISNLRVYITQQRLSNAEAKAKYDEGKGASSDTLRADYKAIRDAGRTAAAAAGARLPRPSDAAVVEGGGRSYTDPAAAASAAREAKAAAAKAASDRKREAERQKRVADDSARLDDALLSSRAQITADVEEQARIERDRLSRDTTAKLADVNAQVAAKQVTAAEAKSLRAKIERNAAVSADAINQRENIDLERAANDLASARLDDLRDIAGSDSALATNLSISGIFEDAITANISELTGLSAYAGSNPRAVLGEYYNSITAGASGAQATTKTQAMVTAAKAGWSSLKIALQTAQASPRDTSNETNRTAYNNALVAGLTGVNALIRIDQNANIGTTGADSSGTYFKLSDPPHLTGTSSTSGYRTKAGLISTVVAAM